MNREPSRDRDGAAPGPGPGRAGAAPSPRAELAHRVRQVTRLVQDDAPRTGALTTAQFTAMLTAGERVMGTTLGRPAAPLLDDQETRRVWSAQLARVAPALSRAPDDAVRRLIGVLPRVLTEQRRPGVTDQMCVNFGFDVALRQVARELAQTPEPAAPRAPAAVAARPIAQPPARLPAPPLVQQLASERAERIHNHYRAMAVAHPHLAADRLAEQHASAILAEGAIGARAAARAAGLGRPDYTQPATLGAFSARLEEADRRIRETDLVPLLARYHVDAARAVYTAHLASLELPIAASTLPRALLERGPEQPYDDGLHGVARKAAQAWRAHDRAWKHEYAVARQQAPPPPPTRAAYLDERVAALAAESMDEQLARGRAQAEFAHARGVQHAVFAQSRLEGDHPRLREAFWQGLREARTQLDPFRPDEARPAIAAVLGRQAEAAVEQANDAYKQARLDTRGEGHIGTSRTHVDSARHELARARAARDALNARVDQVHTVLAEHAVRFHALVQAHGARDGTLILAREIRADLSAPLQQALFVDSRAALSRVEREQRRARGEPDRYLPGPLLVDLATLAREGRHCLARLATQDAMRQRLAQAGDGAASRALRDAAAGLVRDHVPIAIGVITAPAALDGRQVSERLVAALRTRPQARILVAGGEVGRAIYQQAMDLADGTHAVEPAYFSTAWTDAPAGDQGARRSPQRAVVDQLLAEQAAGREAVLLILHHLTPDPTLERLAGALEARGVRVEQVTAPAPRETGRAAPADTLPRSAQARLAAAHAAGLPDQVIRLAAQTIPIWRELRTRERSNQALLPDIEARLGRMDGQIREEQLRAVETVGKAAVALAKTGPPASSEQRDALSAGIAGLRGYYAALRAAGDVELPRSALAAITDHGRGTAGRMGRVLAGIDAVGQLIADRHANDRQHGSAIAVALGQALAAGGIGASRAQSLRLDMQALGAAARPPRGVPTFAQALGHARGYPPQLGQHGPALAAALARYDGTVRVLNQQHDQAARAVVTAIDALRGPEPRSQVAGDPGIGAIRAYYDRFSRAGGGGRFPAEAIGALRETAGAVTALADGLARGEGTLDLLAFSRETLGHAARDLETITGRQLASLEPTPGHRAAVRAMAEQERADTIKAKRAEGLSTATAWLFGAAAALRVSEQDARPVERYFRFLDLQEDIRAQQARLRERTQTRLAQTAAARRADGSLDPRLVREQPGLAADRRDAGALAALSEEIASRERVDLARHAALRDRHLAMALREAGRLMVDLRARGRAEIVVQLWGKHTMIERALDPERARNEVEFDFYAAERAHAMSTLDSSVDSLRRVAQGLLAGRSEQWAWGRLAPWARQDPTRFPTEIGSRETLRALRRDVARLAQSPADLASLADLAATIRTPRGERLDLELGDMNSRDPEARAYQERRRAEVAERDRIASAEHGVDEQLRELIDDLTGLRFA